MNLTLKQLVTPSIGQSVLLISFSIPVWFIFLLIGNRPPDLHIEMFAIPNFIVIEGWITNIFSYAFLLFNAFLIAQFNTRHSVIRTRTFLPVLIFMIAMSVWEGLHNNLLPHAMLTLVIFSLFVFFEVYRSTHDAEMVFVSTLLLGIAGFIVPALVYLLPVFWIGLFQFKSLSLRTWLGSIFGFAAPWVIYLSVKTYVAPDFGWVEGLLSKLLFTMPSFLIHEYVYLGTGVLWLLLLFPSLIEKYQGDSIQGRSRLRFLIVMLLAASLLAFFSLGGFMFFLSISILCYTILLSHPLSLTMRNFQSIIFYLFSASNFLFIAYQLYYKFFV